MATRSVQWRRRKPEEVEARTEEALQRTLYIVHQAGPTSFILKEEGRERKFKTCLGSPHQCTCSVFRREGELCVHILWLLLKKFKVPKDSLLSFQLGLVEREISEILYKSHTHQQQQADDGRGGGGGDSAKPLSSVDILSSTVRRRAIGAEDVCPICQEQFSARPLAIAYCKLSCGQNVHVRCMKIWAEHQVDSEGSSDIRCPVCRGRFLPLRVLCGSDLCVYKPIPSNADENGDHLQQDSRFGGKRLQDRAEHLISRLRAFPVSERGGGGGWVCEMCGEVARRGDWFRKMPLCGHKFHRECIDGWLRAGHSACPLDATKILPPLTKKNKTESHEAEERSRRRREKERIDRITLTGHSLLPEINNCCDRTLPATINTTTRPKDRGREQQRSHDKSHDLLLPSLSINTSPNASQPHRGVVARKWPPVMMSVRKGLSPSLSVSRPGVRMEQLQNSRTKEVYSGLVVSRCSLPSAHSPPPPPLLPHPDR